MKTESNNLKANSAVAGKVVAQRMTREEGEKEK